jgi:hypothetical protein
VASGSGGYNGSHWHSPLALWCPSVKLNLSEKMGRFMRISSSLVNAQNTLH